MDATPAGTYNRGIYFTNLHDWNTGHQPLAKAKQLFQNKLDLNFDYGNNSATAKASYLIRGKSEELNSSRAFKVDRVEIGGLQV